MFFIQSIIKRNYFIASFSLTYYVSVVLYLEAFLRSCFFVEKHFFSYFRFADKHIKLLGV